MRTFNFRLPCTSQKRMCLSSLMSSSRSGNMISLLKRSQNLENVSVLKCIYSYTQTAQISREFPYLAGKHRFLTDELICKIIFNNRSSSSKVKWLNNSAVMSFTRKCTRTRPFLVFKREPGELDRAHEVEAYWSACRENSKLKTTTKTTHENGQKRPRKTEKNSFFVLAWVLLQGTYNFSLCPICSWVVTRREKTLFFIPFPSLKFIIKLFMLLSTKRAFCRSLISQV